MSIRDFNIAIFTVLLLASNVIILKEAYLYCSLDIFNMLRFSIFLLIIPFLTLGKGKFKHILIFGFFNCFLNFIFISKAISTGLLASYVGLLSVPRVILIILMALIFLKEKFNFYQIFGMALSCLALILFKVDSNAIVQTGIIYLFLSALSWAIATTYLKKKNLKFSLSDLCYANAVSAPMMMIYLFATGQTDLSGIPQLVDSNFIIMILYAALVPILFATYLWNRLLSKYDAIQLNPLMNLFPFMVFFESIIFLNEEFNPTFMGLLLVLFFSLLMCQNYRPWLAFKKAKTTS